MNRLFVLLSTSNLLNIWISWLNIALKLIYVLVICRYSLLNTFWFYKWLNSIILPKIILNFLIFLRPKNLLICSIIYYMILLLVVIWLRSIFIHHLILFIGKISLCFWLLKLFIDLINVLIIHIWWSIRINWISLLIIRCGISILLLIWLLLL